MSIKCSVVGDRVVGEAVNIGFDEKTVHHTNNEFWSTVGSENLGVTALPSYGGYISEENHNLLGNLSGKKVLDVCCGNGRSLEYAYNKGAKELWGIDISQEQINRTAQFLLTQGINAKLVCSPMEKECCIPKNYFDVVYSVFGIGWTTDLQTTFDLIHLYLKTNGVFVFNWSHPIHKCTYVEDDKLIFGNPYFDEDWYSTDVGGKEIMLSNRMLSTYINALAKSGFIIEKIIEKPDEDLLLHENTSLSRKARIVPTSFVIKARKL